MSVLIPGLVWGLSALNFFVLVSLESHPKHTKNATHESAHHLFDKWCAKYPKKKRTGSDDLHAPTRPRNIQGSKLPWMGYAVQFFLVLLWDRFGLETSIFPTIVIIFLLK